MKAPGHAALLGRPSSLPKQLGRRYPHRRARLSFCMAKSLLLTVCRDNEPLGICSHMDCYRLQCSKLAFSSEAFLKPKTPALKRGSALMLRVPTCPNQSALTKPRSLTTDGRCSCRTQNPPRQTSSPSPWISGRASPLACPLGESKAEKGVRKDTARSQAFSTRLEGSGQQLHSSQPTNKTSTPGNTRRVPIHTQPDTKQVSKAQHQAPPANCSCQHGGSCLGVCQWCWRGT